MRNGPKAIVAGMLSAAVIGCDPIVIAGIHAPVVGSGRVVSEGRPITDVREVVLSGFGTVVIVEGRRPALVVTAEDNLLPLLATQATGRRLTLSSLAAMRPRHEIVYHLTVRDLDELVLSGAGEAELVDINTAFLDVVISGAGRVSARGHVDDQRVLISGDGQYLAEDLASRFARIEVSGSGYAVVWVRDALDALVSGSGLIEFYGRPVLRQTVSGTGAVLWRGP